MNTLKPLAQAYGLTNWIDTLYEAEFDPNHKSFLLKLASVAAAIDLAETTPLTDEYQQRLLIIAALAYQRGMEAMEEWAIDNSQPPHG
jgi:hypothetical protein